MHRTASASPTHGARGRLSLEERGVGLARHLSAVRDFFSDEEVKAIYYPEAEQLLRDLTRADRVHVFDTTVRRRVPGAEDRVAVQPRQPVPRVHVDHTEKSGPQRVRDLLRIKGALAALSASCHGGGPVEGCPILEALRGGEGPPSA